MINIRLFKRVLIAILALSLSACGSKTGNNEHEGHATETPATTEAPAPAEQPAAAPQHTVSAEFKKQLSALFDSYATLKDAFVSSDVSKVRQGAASTLGALQKVDMMLLSGAAHHDWMTYLEGMKKSLQEISAASDIEVQRTSFSTLSNDLYKSIKAFGLNGETAYYEFCPMAFGNKGAYWLAKEDKIKNPYSGDKMLTCGSVEETLH